MVKFSGFQVLTSIGNPQAINDKLGSRISLFPTSVQGETSHDYKPNTMKRLLSSLFCLIAISSSYSQDYQYSKTYDRSDFDEARPITSEVTLDQGLITISNSLTSGQDGGIILRINSDGGIAWEKKYYGPSANEGLYFNDVIATYDSSYIVTGQILDSISSNYYPFCMKINDQGDTLWTKTFDFSTQLNGNFGTFLSLNTQANETSDSSILMTWQHSSFEDFPSNPDHLCVSKLTSSGNLLWSNSLLVDSTFLATEIVEAQDQSIYVIGNTTNLVGSGYVVHLSEMGSFDWAKKYDEILFREIITDSSGFAVSYINSQLQNSGIMKFDSMGVNTKRIECSSWVYVKEPSFNRRSNGNYLLAQRGDNYGGGSFFEVDDTLALVGSYSISMILQSVRCIPNYGVYLVGYGPLYGIKSDYNQIGITRLDSLMGGGLLWSCSWPESYTVSVSNTVTDQAVFFTSADSITQFNLPITNSPVTSVVEDGCVTFLGSVDENEGTWNEIVSPNPSTGKFTVSWDTFREAELIVYNSIGMVVLRSKTKNSFVEIDLQTEQTGLYHYRLVDTEGSQSSGMLMVTN